MIIPYSWVTYCDENPAFGRWDQNHLARIFAGEEWTIPGVSFREVQWRKARDFPQIAVFPAGHYAEHGCWRRILPKLNWDLSQTAGGILIITSDEGSTFPVHLLKLPPDWVLWLQWPDPAVDYPPYAHIIPEGSPSSARHMKAAGVGEPSDVFFSGQVNHDRRRQLVETLDRWTEDHRVVCYPSEGFGGGLLPWEYHREMQATKIAPCPSGHVTQSSFRVWEALEAGVLPVVDAVRPDGAANGYWDYAYRNFPLHTVDDWRTLPAWVSSVLDGARPWALDQETALALSWWQQLKRAMVRTMVHQVAGIAEEDLDESITVLVSTSPSPLHPDPSQIHEVLRSIRERLPNAEILVMADGVRDEQRHRREAYWSYVADLCRFVQTEMTNTAVLAHRRHQHQANMTAAALRTVTSEFVLFVEHDTPLVGDIDFDEIIGTMRAERLNLMRFHYWDAVHPDHEWLFLETTPRDGYNHIRTMQWSQRPHIARSRFYADILARYFDPSGRTMIEDVMFGVLANAWRLRAQAGWEQWRVGMYAPAGGYQRSGHLDGRRDDPKYPMLITYPPGEKPAGAPRPGLHG